ncbi:MAG: hypothetical protein EXR61_05225 [Chloroflexi bacterium]|nr:hypothetical protein [Chloroflexota bacterium]
MHMVEQRWRTVDIVVAATIAVAFGVVFFAWNSVWAGLKPAFVFMPPARNLIYGMWLVPAVLGALIVRKPGAALFTELVAAIVASLLGSQWGLDTILSGFVQGAAAELVFALTLYRTWTPVVAVAAGAAAGFGAWIHDMPVYFAKVALGDQLVIGAFMLASAAVIAGLGSQALLTALTRTGVLASFAAGRTQQRI